MSNCDACKRTDVKCCNTCARNASVCEVWHTCGEDCLCYKNKTMTNGDRIRSMTDEELTEFLFSDDYYIDCTTCKEPENEYGTCIGKCENELLRWLKSEVGCEQ